MLTPAQLQQVLALLASAPQQFTAIGANLDQMQATMDGLIIQVQKLSGVPAAQQATPVTAGQLQTGGTTQTGTVQ